MTEGEARAWLSTHFDVSRETTARLERFVALLISEAGQQNLIAASTILTIWARHIVDSAQLLLQANDARRWLDLGSGAGLPGLVLAILGVPHVTLVDERALRCRFLGDVIEDLGLGSTVRVVQTSIQRLVPDDHDHISARAVAPLTKLFDMAGHLAAQDTRWILPKGRNANKELADAQQTWQGEFRSVPSVTDPAATIVVARDIRRKVPR